MEVGEIEPDERMLERLAGVQRKLAGRLRTVKLDLNGVKTVGAVDVSYRGNRARAAFVLCSSPECRPLLQEVTVTDVAFPYVPTFFFLRETKPVIMAVLRAGKKPDILLVGGHGRAHPRGYGLASHVGLVLGVPTVGVARRLLRGTPEGSFKKVGRVYVSEGNLIDLDSAVRIVEMTLDGGCPKPLKLADRLSKRWEDG